MYVEHACDTVKAEAIELVFFHPEAEIGEQEPEDFVVAVVEDTAVPQLVSASRTFVKVEMVAVVKHLEPVEYVLAGVAVYHIQFHNETHAVRSINQLFQVVWMPVSRACGEEAVDLISEAGVVRMFHDGHQLNGVVS